MQAKIRRGPGVISKSTKEKQRIEKFCTVYYGNGWLTYGSLKVYLRMSRRSLTINNSLRTGLVYCLDIASLNIDDPAKRGKGTFKKFLTFIEEAAKKGEVAKYLYLENVINPQLTEHMYKRHSEGWRYVDPSLPNLPCFYKKLTQEEEKE